MKNFSFIILSILTFSCGYNKEEQMLYDYRQKKVQTLNFDLKDLDFKIEKIEKVNYITAADSIKLIRQSLVAFLPKNLEQPILSDTF